MASFYSDNEDLRFYVERYIDWKPVVELSELGFRRDDGFKDLAEAVETYRDVLNLVGEFVANEIAPHAAEIDRAAVEYRDGEASLPARQEAIFEAINALELHGLPVPRELGGMNLPMLVYHLNSEMFARAEVSVMAHHGFHGGIAMAMLLFSVREGTTTYDKDSLRITGTRFDKEIAEIVAGKAWGCMDITEPDAGSDMANLRAVGELGDDGVWRVSGTKIFITSGHGKYHFVIARTEKASDPNDMAAGLAGLSMFLVPTYEDLPDGTRKRVVSLDRVEHKLGHNGSVTAALTFDKAPAHLIGKRGEGFHHMLTLMNNARIGVGFESLGLCEAAFRLAKAYAAERPSMGKPIDRHEMIADYLDEMESDIQGIRALAVQAAIDEEMSQKLDLYLTHLPPASDLERESMRKRAKRHKRDARRSTPLLKYLASEKAVEMGRRAVQIHGGNGYTTEYGAEKLLRDALVMPIYEGTSQIQSLMAMKDTLGAITKNPQAFIRRQAKARIASLRAKDPLERRVAKLQVLSMNVQQTLMTRTAVDKLRTLGDVPVAAWGKTLSANWDPKRDFAWAMLHAERLTRILADELVCEKLLDQALAHPDRRPVLERYLERAEPRCRFLADQIHTTGDRLLRSLGRIDDADATEKAG